MIFWPAFILITSSLAITGGVIALTFLFITKSETRDFVDRTDRARWWRESWRQKQSRRLL